MRAYSHRATLCLSLLCVLRISIGLGSARAGASTEGPFTFAWTAPDGCPSADELRAAIDKLLGETAQARAHEPLAVHAVVAHAGAWTVAIETRSPTSTGHRTLDATTCQGLANATALIVALAIDPDAVAAHGGRASEPLPAARPVSAETSLPLSSVAPRSTFGVVGLVGAASLGVVPGLDVDLGGELGLVRGRWRVELRAVYGLRAQDSPPVSGAMGAHGRFRFFAGTLAGCWIVARGRVQVGPCADVEVGAVHGQGIGSDQDAAATTPWYGLGAGLVAVIAPTPWLHFPLHADAVLPLRRPSYRFEGVQASIYDPWPVGVRLTAGVELQF
jgi:hypothetical protein